MPGRLAMTYLHVTNVFMYQLNVKSYVVKEHAGKENENLHGQDKTSCLKKGLLHRTIPRWLEIQSKQA